MTTQMSLRELKRLRINWEGLKKFVEKRSVIRAVLLKDSPKEAYFKEGQIYESQAILAEIERLEEGK